MNENFLSPGGVAAPKIIKKNDGRNAGIIFGGLIKKQVADAEEAARRIRRETASAAENLIAAAGSAADEIRREAYRAGRDRAESETLDNLLAIKERRAEVLSTIEAEILKLSVKIAEKIIGGEIKQDEATRAEIVLNALRQTRQQEFLTVRVSAEDLPLLEKMREKIDNYGRAKFVDFVADQAVKSGGCIIESSSGTIDARLETQLRILENALLREVKSEKREESEK